MTDNTAKEILQRSGKLIEARQSLMTTWQELADHFYIERADFTTERSLGDTFADHLSTSEPMMMRRDLGNAIGAMLRPSGRTWAEMSILDENRRKADHVRVWLKSRTGILWRALYDPATSFVRAMREADHDIATFGNAVLTAEEVQGLGRLRFKCHHPRDVVWVDDADGRTDTVYRTMSLSARQIGQTFRGEKVKLHKTILTALEKEPDKAFSIRHCMMPASEYDTVKLPGAGGAKWLSIYVDVDNAEVIRVAPSHDLRYVILRWQTMGNSQYGLSPAAVVALPDARMMQSLARIVQEAGEKSVDPPVRAIEGAIRGDINLFASGVTWIDREYDERTGAAIEPIQLGKDAGLGIHLMQQLQATMREAWYLTKLTLPMSGAKTAYETQQLVEEALRASAPLFEPMEENNALVLDAATNVLLRLGVFGDKSTQPRELDGQEFTFSFANPLHDAVEKQKVLEYQTVMGLIEMGTRVNIQTPPDFNVREAFRDAVSAVGAETWLIDRKEADEAADAQTKAAELQETMAGVGMGGQAAEAVGKGMQAMMPAAQEAA